MNLVIPLSKDRLFSTKIVDVIQVSVTAREDVPHFGPKLPNPAIFKKVCYCGVAQFFCSNVFFLIPLSPSFRSRFFPYPSLLIILSSLKVQSIICWFVGPGISQVLIDQTDKCRAVCLQQCRVRQISGESNNILILLSACTLCTCYLFLSVKFSRIELAPVYFVH